MFLCIKPFCNKSKVNEAGAHRPAYSTQMSHKNGSWKLRIEKYKVRIGKYKVRIACYKVIIVI